MSSSPGSIAVMTSSGPATEESHSSTLEPAVLRVLRKMSLCAYEMTVTTSPWSCGGGGLLARCSTKRVLVGCGRRPRRAYPSPALRASTSYGPW